MVFIVSSRVSKLEAVEENQTAGSCIRLCSKCISLSPNQQDLKAKAGLKLILIPVRSSDIEGISI